MARDIEKNEILRIVMGHSYIPTNYINNPLLNPNTNTITNIDYQYTYQPINKSSQYPNQASFGFGSIWPTKPN